MGLVMRQMLCGIQIPDNDPDIEFKRNWYTQLQPFWVYPSMFYADADGE